MQMKVFLWWVTCFDVLRLLPKLKLHRSTVPGLAAGIALACKVFFSDAWCRFVSSRVRVLSKVAKELGGMTKRIKDEETGLSVMDVQDFRRRFPDGRMFSNPGLATPEHGRRLLEAAVRDATEALGKFLSGQDLVEEAEMKAKRAAAMEAAAAAVAAKGGESAGASAGTAGVGVSAAGETKQKRPRKNEFRPRPRWGDDGERRAGRGRGRGRGSGGGRGGGQAARAPVAGGATDGAAAAAATAAVTAPGR